MSPVLMLKHAPCQGQRTLPLQYTPANQKNNKLPGSVGDSDVRVLHPTNSYGPMETGPRFKI